MRFPRPHRRFRGEIIRPSKTRTTLNIIRSMTRVSDSRSLSPIGRVLSASETIEAALHPRGVSDSSGEFPLFTFTRVVVILSTAACATLLHR